MYLAIITLYKVIIAGALNFKVAVSPFLNVYMEVISAIAEKSILKSTKEFDISLIQRALQVFLCNLLQN